MFSPVPLTVRGRRDSAIRRADGIFSVELFSLETQDNSGGKEIITEEKKTQNKPTTTNITFFFSLFPQIRNSYFLAMVLAHTNPSECFSQAVF